MNAANSPRPKLLSLRRDNHSHKHLEYQIPGVQVWNPTYVLWNLTKLKFHSLQYTTQTSTSSYGPTSSSVVYNPVFVILFQVKRTAFLKNINLCKIIMSLPSLLFSLMCPCLKLFFSFEWKFKSCSHSKYGNYVNFTISLDHSFYYGVILLLFLILTLINTINIVIIILVKCLLRGYNFKSWWTVIDLQNDIKK